MRIVGHGIDIVSVARIARMLDDHDERFLERCFTPSEREYAMSQRRAPEHLAARFAAKEAILKALGTGLTNGIQWTDVEIVRSATGRPEARLHAGALRIAQELGIGEWRLSMSHSDDAAVASAIAITPGA